MQDASGSNPLALAAQIRAACVNVGFFYGQCCLVILNPSLNYPTSQEPRYTRRRFTGCHQKCQAILFPPARGKDQGASSALVRQSWPTSRQLDIHRTPNFKGYTTLLGENANPDNIGDLHEGFDIGWESISRGVDTQVRGPGPMTGGNVWPEHLPGFREDVLTY